MFLYISLVDMVPEMNESVETASRLGTAEAIRKVIDVTLGFKCVYDFC